MKSTSINILIQLMIFISASPLFENIGKILFSMFIILLIIFFRKPNLKFSQENLIILFFFSVSILLYGSLLDFFYSTSFDAIGIGFWISIVIGYFLSNLVTKDEVLLNNEKLMFWSVLIGIPIFILSQYFPIIIEKAISYTYGGFTHKTFVILNFHTSEDDILSERFVGLGREPGVTQIFLLLAIWYRLKRKQVFDFKVLILISGLLLGKSTAGFFTLLLILILSIPLKRLIYLVLLSTPLILYIIADLWVYHTDNKLAGSLSFINRYGRYVDFFTGDLISIIGGYGNVYYAKFIGPADLGGWDTFLQVCQRYGVLFFFGLVIILLYSNRNLIIVFIIILISFFSQLVWFYPIISFFYFKSNNRHALK